MAEQDAVRDGRQLMNDAVRSRLERRYALTQARAPLSLIEALEQERPTHTVGDPSVPERTAGLVCHPLAAVAIIPAQTHDCGHVCALGWTWLGKDGPITVCNECFKLLKTEAKRLGLNTPP